MTGAGLHVTRAAIVDGSERVCLLKVGPPCLFEILRDGDWCTNFRACCRVAEIMTKGAAHERPLLWLCFAAES